MADDSAHFDLSKLASNLWVVDMNTQTWRQLTHLKGSGAWSPVWTPDGSTVVFMSNTSGQLDTWMINIDGSNLQQLTFDSRMMPRALGVTP
jgi:TolB protein